MSALLLFCVASSLVACDARSASPSASDKEPSKEEEIRLKNEKKALEWLKKEQREQGVVRESEVAIEASFRGEPLDNKFRGAQAFYTKDGAYTVRLSWLGHLDCKSFDDRLSYPVPLVTLELGEVIHPDGKVGWYVFGASHSSNTVSDPTTLQYPVGVKVSEENLNIDLDLNYPLFGSNLALKGTLEVENCGHRLSGSGQPPARPQPSLQVSIAKHPVTVQTALIKGSELILSESPVSCELLRDFQSLLIRLPLNNPNDAGHPSLSGPRVVATDEPRGAIPVKPFGLTLVSESVLGQSSLRIPLDGELRIEGYDVKISGIVDALVCP